MTDSRTQPWRIGLALASGGCIGVSWELGALEGLRRATGFEPQHSDVVIGTSAGAFVGGVSVTIGASVAYAHTAEEAAPGLKHSISQRDGVARMDRHIMRGGLFDRFPLARLSVPRLGSVAGVRRLARGCAGGLAVGAASLLPEGLLSTRRVGDAFREVCPAGWPISRLLISTFDMNTATPRVLSAADCEGIGLADAVSASCAIPGMFAPLRFGARRLADGGIWSATHLSELSGMGLDLVVCLHPLIGERAPARSLVTRAVAAVDRSLRGRCLDQLEDEKRALERQGTRVLVISPEPEERARFPRNFMDIDSRGPLMRRAARTVERALLTATGRDAELVACLTAAARPAPRFVAAA